MSRSTITAENARAYVLRVLREAGYRASDARLCADSLVESSLRGVDSHGFIVLLPIYVRHALEGSIQVEASPQVAARRHAVAVVDGRSAPGLSTARLALTTSMQLAKRYGVGAAVARRVGYLGALWWCVLPAADAKMVGISCVNGEACVAPFGGREPLHGTNPISVAIPHSPEPILLDMRTNLFRMADYWENFLSGGPLSVEGLVTKEGEPIRHLEDVNTAIYLADAKGYGLALVIDILTAAFAGGPIGRELAGNDARGQNSAFFLALDPDAFGPYEQFVQRVGALAEQAHSTAPLAPLHLVRLPGERGHKERERRLSQGIPVEPSLWKRMEHELDDLGISTPTPLI